MPRQYPHGVPERSRLVKRDLTGIADQAAGPGGLVRYFGEISLDQPGSFGYTVRILPKHPLLDSRAELGLVTYPQAPAGLTNGDLR